MPRDPSDPGGDLPPSDDSDNPSGTSDESPVQQVVVVKIPEVAFPGHSVGPVRFKPGEYAQAVTATAESKDYVLLTLRDDLHREILHEGEEGLLPQYDVGVLARVIKSENGADGKTIAINFETVARADIREMAFISEGYHVAEVAELPPPDLSYDGAAETAAKSVRDLLGTSIPVLFGANPAAGSFKQAIAVTKTPSDLAHVVGTWLRAFSSLAETEEEKLDLFAQKQRVLEAGDTVERLKALHALIKDQVARKQIKDDLNQDLDADVKAEFERIQQTNFLHVRRKMINKRLRELGEDDGSGIVDLEKRIAEADLSPKAREEVEKQFKRLQGMSADSAEAVVVKTRIGTILDLPWNERSELNYDLALVQERLDEDHYGRQKLKEAILEYLAVQKLRSEKLAGADKQEGNDSDKNESKATIILLEGPPGTGKTSIAKGIARAQGREFARISLGGVRDEAEIRGHRQTYIGAIPGQIIKAVRETGTKNPVILLDEIDKMGADVKGDPTSALLEVLDPEQNSTFVDHYLGLPFDLSEVLFITTANFIEQIPAPLIDRMERYRLGGYTEQEKLEIFKRHILKKTMAGDSLDDDDLSIGDAAVKAIIGGYTNEAGLRGLERETGKITRRRARNKVEGQEEPLVVTTDNLSDFLGPSRRDNMRLGEQEDEVGVVNGLYYTPAGGGVLQVEVAKSPGKGEIILTGSLGDVMKESVRTAISAVKAHADEFGIDLKDFTTNDFHFHFPKGAIPKDGPSAGLTIGTALVSCIKERPAKKTVAMTGEVTIRGRALTIGGLQEKLLGAARDGVKTVLLAEKNRQDYDALPEDVRRDAPDVKFVAHLRDNVEHTLGPAIDVPTPDSEPEVELPGWRQSLSNFFNGLGRLVGSPGFKLDSRTPSDDFDPQP